MKNWVPKLKAARAILRLLFLKSIQVVGEGQIAGGVW